MSPYPISNVAGLGFLLTISHQACTHTMVLSPTPPQREFDRVNRTFADRGARVRFGSGGGRILGPGVFSLHNLHLEPDSVRFTSPSEGRVTIPAEMFLSAEYRDRVRGTREGALIGMVIGGLGLLINQALPSRNSSSGFGDVTKGDCNSSCTGKVILAGALYGGIIGFIRQSRVKVVRQPSGPGR